MAALDQTTALENELAGLRAAHDLLLGERDGLRRYVRKLLATIRAAQLALSPNYGCDDCPGRPDCRCADGHADTTDCTCPPQGGNS